MTFTYPTECQEGANFATAVLLPALPAVIYYRAAGIFQTVKPPTSGRWRYLAVITVVINTHILTILLLKFFPYPNTHQRSKAHFLVITHGGVAPMQFTRWTSINNRCEQLAVHCSAVGRRTAAVTRCLHRAPRRQKPYGKGKDINSV